MPNTDTEPRPLLSIEDLNVEVHVDDAWVPVVEHVNLTIGRNEIVGLVGESGSGKTLTAMSILRLLPRTVRIASGRIAFEGVDLAHLGTRQINEFRGGRIGVVFQEPMTSLNPAFTVGDQVAEMVRRHRSVSRSAARARAVEMMDLVGIPSASRRVSDYPHQFSGGMRQRVMIAMALACEPSLLIADEPTTALDVTIQADILDLVRRLRRELDMGILLISHDLGVVSTVCERVNVMYAGEIVEHAGVETIFETPHHPYTEGLLQAMPHFKREDGRMGFIPGRVPGVGAYGDGCRFAPRCRYAIDACIADLPEKRNVGGHQVRCIRAETLDLQGVLE